MSKSESTNDAQPPMTLEKKLSQEHRLCHMVKRPDFDGYGFNLHSEKGKPGQYIGKVDEKSPAEESGLRQGDRIIEVNGVDIGNETHKQVVQRIKAIENEVRLLVVDPDIETRMKQQHQKDQEVASNKEGSPVQNNNNNTSTSKTSSPTTSLKKQQINNNRTSISNASSVDSSSNGQETVTLGTTPSPSPPPPKQAEPSSMQNGASNSNNTSNSSSNNSSNGTAKMSTTGGTSAGLNLKMTAAEMRAKLQARKKYDPKNDSVDLRKKFDIIQKL